MHESRQMLPKWPILYAGNTVMIALLHCVSTSYKSLDNITFRFRLLNVNLKQKTILDSSHTIQKYKNMNKHHIPKHWSVCFFEWCAAHFGTFVTFLTSNTIQHQFIESYKTYLLTWKKKESYKLNFCCGKCSKKTCTK